MLDLRTRKISILPGSLGLYRPRWSPDGRYLAALSADSRRLMLFDFTTRKWAELAKLDIGNPTWSHDGKYIYFDGTPAHGEPAFFRISIGDRKLERVVTMRVAGQSYIWWTGLTPDDSPLMIRDTSTQEIYALDWEAP
jgi:Tol biopolymer transport system component